MCAVAYLIALLFFFLCLRYWPVELLKGDFARVVLADVLATLVVFGFSVAFRNSSFYDPYWSVLPIVISGHWFFQVDRSAPGWSRGLLVLVLVALWGLRLTFNWLRHWKGLGHEDWRHIDLKQKTGRFYPLVNLFGIHIFPTAMVLAALYPVFVTMNSASPLGYLDAVAGAVTLGAIVVETIADRQLHDFVASKPKPESFLCQGLWSWSRHPNYFGETSFWWGLALFGVAATPRFQFSTLLGAVAMTAMFFCISGPIRHLRPDRPTPLPLVEAYL